MFVQDGNTLDGASYTAAQYGGEGASSYATLLDFLLTDAGYFRYTAQQAGTRTNFDRQATDYRVDSDGQLALRNGNNWISGGAITADARLGALVDTTGSDLSFTLLQSKREGGSNSQFQGRYYCGHISNRTPGYARFFRADMNGAGGGSLLVISDRWQQSGSTGLTYQVQDDGTTILDYLGLRLVGALSADGSIFTASEISGTGRGSAICLKASSGKTLNNVAGEYYGASVQIQAPLLTGVSEFDIYANGNADEFVLRDSLGDGGYPMDVGYVLVKFGSRLETLYRDGAISPDGQVIFLIETNPGASPNLALYIRKQ